MVHANPEMRPSPDQLIKILEPICSPAADDVFGYLQRYRRTNSVLQHKVQVSENVKCIFALAVF